MVYGPPGAGKKTRVIVNNVLKGAKNFSVWTRNQFQVMCLLREMYGAGVERLRLEHQTFTTPSKKKVSLNPRTKKNLLSSNVLTLIE